jgi:hypothetical protein
MQAAAQRKKEKTARQDSTVLWLGILFSLLFTGVIWALDGRLQSIELLPDTGASWYYWKLPEPTFWTRFTAWGFYFAHQFTLWGLIYWAQKQKIRYRTSLHPVNWWALGANAFFISLHLLQTHLWYDGLAQDVSIWSSQISVIILLVWVLLMENKRRGLFWGKKLKVSKEINIFARKYHGYYFAWALIYTFWYHPMVGTTGHLWGFFYTFLLLLQGSLFFTRIHVNRWWTFFQEFTVLVHGTIVAVGQGNGLWPMFAFGFGAIFVITQMHGLGLSQRIRFGILGLFIALALWVYNFNVLDAFLELVRIPFIEYLSVLALAGIFWLILRVVGLVQKQPAVGST